MLAAMAVGANPRSRGGTLRLHPVCETAVFAARPSNVCRWLSACGAPGYVPMDEGSQHSPGTSMALSRIAKTATRPEPRRRTARESGNSPARRPASVRSGPERARYSRGRHVARWAGSAAGSIATLADPHRMRRRALAARDARAERGAALGARPPSGTQLDAPKCGRYARRIDRRPARAAGESQ